MSLELKGGDGKWYEWASIDIYRKHITTSDEPETALMLLASIGQELENITELLKREIGD